MGRLAENSVVSTKNKSCSITADVDVPEVGSRGRHHRPGRQHRRLEPLCQGRQAEVLLQLLRHRHYFVESTQPIPAGPHQVRMEFKYDGGGIAKGGDVTLYVDGKAVGEGRVEQTEPMGFSADETCDIGKEGGSPVSPDYGPTGNGFTARSTGCRWISRRTTTTT